MPPRKHKVDHRRGGNSKHISSIDEVKARNNGEETAYDKARRGKAGEEEEEAEEPQEVTKPRKTIEPLISTENPNAVKRNEEKEGVELTRKQREELEKNAARRRYEELHKAGKTDEAKSDLARLEEVKRRREEAKKQRDEEEAKAKEAQASKDKPDRAAILAKELKAMGTDESRIRGARSSKKDKDKEKDKDGKDKDKEKEKDKGDKEEKEDKEEGGGRKIINGVDEGDVYSSYASAVSTKMVEDADKGGGDGTIESCREAEADFM
mmetsp:Transcript_35748/g.80799  ORF Transcript_35748/g.80799 Transcript_35748/m.80799 type:complete len:266 (+) Transcript_35748:78-875(+)|eukprot:CAMPEP_0197883174 /NCGR_PEP_ID=MMETSP1439-20131203/10088_1 /TAXON_ID=66791 /ORGANISM="Gonyaulax spinifera, Strain CCMP409" /LENGTH=265 /DNA_ID=CAMNT_0043502881 /DNA_START=67 /DNA_END=864 /DNA_ORIENTATION=-